MYTVVLSRRTSFMKATMSIYLRGHCFFHGSLGFQVVASFSKHISTSSMTNTLEYPYIKLCDIAGIVYQEKVITLWYHPAILFIDTLLQKAWKLFLELKLLDLEIASLGDFFFLTREARPQW